MSNENKQKITGLNVKTRKDHEPPPVIAQKGWRYHHLGIPTDSPKPGERYLKNLKI